MRPIIVCLVILLAGCSAKAPPAADAGQPMDQAADDVPAAEEAVQTLTGRATLTITNVNLPGDGELSTGAPNCLTFPVSGDVAVRNATFTATWTAQGPANEQLEPHTDVNGVYAAQSHGFQASPATAAVTGLGPWTDAPLRFGMFLPEPGAGGNLEIAVDYTIEYLGALGQEPRLSDCDF